MKLQEKLAASSSDINDMPERLSTLFFLSIVAILLTSPAKADVMPPTAKDILVDILVNEPLLVFSLMLFLTLILEVFMGLIVLFIWRLPKKVLGSLVLANLLSVAVVFIILFVLYRYTKYYNFLIFYPALEGFVILFEAYFIYECNREIFTISKSLTFSLIVNFMSFIVGFFTFLYSQ